MPAFGMMLNKTQMVGEGHGLSLVFHIDANSLVYI